MRFTALEAATQTSTAQRRLPRRSLWCTILGREPRLDPLPLPSLAPGGDHRFTHKDDIAELHFELASSSPVPIQTWRWRWVKYRIRDALSVGAENLVTVCPTCEPTLLRGASRLANETNVFVDVRSLWDLLDEAFRQEQ